MSASVMSTVASSPRSTARTAVEFRRAAGGYNPRGYPL